MTTLNPLQPDLKTALEFLNALEPNGHFTFQTFDDRKSGKNSSLARVLHGTLAEHANALTDLNNQGAGVFVTVNKTDLRGRKLENIVSVRALFVDLDGAPLTPILDSQVEPNIIIESSPGRWHAYWLCELSKEEFSLGQARLIKLFDGDTAVKDLPRVMRLPGFFHLKAFDGSPDGAFMTRIEQMTTAAKGERRYTSDELSAFVSFNRPENEEDREYSRVGDSENSHNITLEVIRDALKFVDPEPRSNFIDIGHALKSEGETFFTTYLEWCRGDLTGQRPKSYVDDEDVKKCWHTFAPNRTSVEAVISKAIENGFIWNGGRRAKTTIRSSSHVHLAHHLAKKHSTPEIPLVFDEGNFWQYNGSYWQKLSDNVVRKMVHGLDGQPYGDGKRHICLSRGAIDGIARELITISEKEGFFNTDIVGVNLRDGFVRINNEGKPSLEPHSQDHRQRSIIAADWAPHLCGELGGYTRKLFDGCFGEADTALRQLILEVIGTTILGIGTRISAPKAFVLHGQTANNGKSRILKLIRGLLPWESVCSIPPADLDQPQSLAALVGCAANLSDELSSSRSIASDKMKAVITGDDVSAKVIYREVFKFTPRATHVFATNGLPTFHGGVDAGVERRMVVIPFNRTIPENERIADIAERILANEASILVSTCILAGAAVYKNNHYQIPPDCLRATADWFSEADPVREWLEDGGLTRVVGVQVLDLRTLYKRFCEELEDLVGRQYRPTRKRFIAQLRLLIARDPEWIITRRSAGNVIQRNTLV